MPFSAPTFLTASSSKFSEAFLTSTSNASHVLPVNTEESFDHFNCPFDCSWWYSSFEEEKPCHLKTLQQVWLTCLLLNKSLSSSCFHWKNLILIWYTSENNDCLEILNSLRTLDGTKLFPLDLTFYEKRVPFVDLTAAFGSTDLTVLPENWDHVRDNQYLLSSLVAAKCSKVTTVTPSRHSIQIPVGMNWDLIFYLHTPALT